MRIRADVNCVSPSFFSDLSAIKACISCISLIFHRIFSFVKRAIIVNSAANQSDLCPVNRAAMRTGLVPLCFMVIITKNNDKTE